MKYLKLYSEYSGYAEDELKLPYPCVSFINDETEEVIYEPLPSYVVGNYEITPEDMEANPNGIMVYMSDIAKIDEVDINGNIMEISSELEVKSSFMAFETQTLNGIEYRVPTKENRIFGGEAINSISFKFDEDPGGNSTGFLYTLIFENDVLVNFKSTFTSLGNRWQFDDNGARIVPYTYYDNILYEDPSYSIAFLYHCVEADFEGGLEPQDVVTTVYKTYNYTFKIPYESITETKEYTVKYRFEKKINSIGSEFNMPYLKSFDTSLLNPYTEFTLEMGAFTENSSLEDVIIDNINLVDEWSVGLCDNLKTIHVGSNVNSISYAFGYNPNIDVITVDERNKYYDSRENCNAIIEKENKILCYGSNLTVIPNSVEIIDMGAFCGLANITEIVVPNNVQAIGDYAFESCISLSSVTLGSKLSYLGTDVFYGDENLKHIKSEAMIAPQVDEYTFEDIGENGTLDIYLGAQGYNTWMSTEEVYLGFYGWNKQIIIPDDFEDEVIMTSESNPRVMEVCYNQGWTTYEDKMYLSEAMSVDDIGTAFAGQIPYSSSYTTVPENVNGIVNFDEFVYFTNVTEISAAFRGLTNLTSITIPDSVTNIGDNAFYKCTSLTNIELPNSVTNIGDNAFSNCSGLTNIELPNSVTNIGDNAFAYCNNITALYIPDSITELGINACRPMQNLVSISTPLIPVNGFSGNTKLSTVDLRGDRITMIGDKYFCNCSILTSIIIPDSVETIGSYAFVNCSSLSNITIGRGVTSVANNAFSGCTSLPIVDGLRYADTVVVDVTDNTLTNYNLKEGTRLIATKFNSCDSMTNIILSDTLEAIPEKTFSGCTNLVDIVIPNGVKEISSYAFNGCQRLTTITIGKNVQNIYSATFYGTPSLATFIIDSDNLYYNDGGNNGCIYNIETKELVRGNYNTVIPNDTERIGGYAFQSCDLLTSLVIPENVKEIGPYAFANSAISSITLPSNLEAIYNYTFSGCTNLSSITLPQSIKNIYDYVFTRCIALSSIIVPDSVTTIGAYCFSGCTNMTSVTVGSGITTINSGAFKYCSSLTTITSKANTAPSISSTTFQYVGADGILYYPQGSDYSTWMRTSSYYLGYRNWVSQEIVE